MAPLPPVRGVDAPEAVRGLDIGEGDNLPLLCCGDLDLKSGLPMGETGQDIFLWIWISLEIDEMISDYHWQCVNSLACIFVCVCVWVSELERYLSWGLFFKTLEEWTKSLSESKADRFLPCPMPWNWCNYYKNKTREYRLSSTKLARKTCCDLIFGRYFMLINTKQDLYYF